MKKFFFLLAFFVTVCCADNSAEKTALQFIKQNKTLPSLTFNRVDVITDTVPIFLNKAILDSVASIYKAEKDLQYIQSQQGMLLPFEKSSYNSKLKEAQDILQKAQDNFRKLCTETKETSQIESIVIASYTWKGVLTGSSKTGKAIIVVDKEQQDKVLGGYFLDDYSLERPNFGDRVKLILSLNGKELKETPYGKIDSKYLTTIENFIFE